MVLKKIRAYLPSGMNQITEAVLANLLMAFVQGCPSDSMIPEGFDDWRGLQEFAAGNGVEGVFSDMMGTLQMRAPSAWIENIQQRYIDRFTKNTVALLQLKELAEAFDHAGIDVMVFKGALFLLSLDKDPGYRELSDIDLLVKRKDIHAAVRLMDSMGYKPLFKHGKSVLDTDLALIESGRTGHLPQFVIKDRLPVEIHINALSGEGDWAAAEKDIWSYCAEIQIGNAGIYCPSELHSLLQGSSHYMKHERTDEGGTLKWLVDVALQTRASNGKVNPDDLGATAKRWGVAEALSGALSLASGIAGPEAMSHVLRRYDKTPDASRAQDDLFYIKTLLVAGTLPTFRQKLRYVFQLMFPDRSHMEQWRQIRPGAWLAPHYAWRLIQIVGRLLKEIRAM